MEQEQITLTLTLAEVDVLLNGLNELPHKVSRIVFDKVMIQIKEQLKQKEKE